MERAFVGIGANLGDRQANLMLAQRELGRLPRTELKGFSGVYETEPVGPGPQPPFLNAVAELRTDLEPGQLLEHLRNIERLSGREARLQRVKWGPRTLDLDVLLFGDRVVLEDELVVPHPLMHQRWFVLRPLADLAPDLMHPRLGRSVRELLQDVEAAGRPGGALRPQE